MSGVHLLGISGSPKIGGFTNFLLDKALAGAKQSGAYTEKIVLNDLNFKPCQECGGCDKTGICILDDDMKFVYESLARAGAVIIASPIYFGSVTAQLKAMIDRCNSLWMAKKKWGHPFSRDMLAMKNECPHFCKGVFLCVGGKDSKSYFENAKSVIKIFFATLNIEYSSDLFIGGLNTMPADSPERNSALEKTFQLGDSLVRF
ncbi:MAG: flavodoxin family protein [Candidatus Omnitrophota bacterium]|nr:flavodoxin family protein [Candidatus Omnitrophota bacterium]